MFKINFSEIFPTKWTVLVFVVYMTLFINQGILVTASQKSNNSYSYNTVLAVFLTEIVKMVASIVMYSYNHPILSLFVQTKNHIKLLGMYFISSSLYCLYNNLSYINLSTYDPTTYFLLLQLRVVITGIIYQILFHKYLSCIQWVSLIILMFGCMMKEIKLDFLFDTRIALPIGDNLKKEPIFIKETGAHLNVGLLMIVIQALSSCFAGVYNEFLLKRTGEHVNLFIQNMFICLDSIICNCIILLCQWDKDVFSAQSISSISNPKVMAVIINNAAAGIATSFFLKYLNSILKTFTSAVELVFIAIFSWIIFGIDVHLNTVFSIATVSFAILLYSRNPVASSISSTSSSNGSINKEKSLKDSPA